MKNVKQMGLRAWEKKDEFDCILSSMFSELKKLQR